MGNTGSRFVYMAPDGDGTGGGGTGGGGQQQQQQVVPFADAAAARGFLKDWVPSEDYVKPFDDAKVIPFATHLKGRVDEMGKSFPGNWREQLAAGNAEHLKTLERFKTPVDLYGAYGSLRQKLSSGELRAVVPFPDKGTPEEQNAWRTTNQIPEKPEDYNLAQYLPKDFKVDDDDKAIFDSMAKDLHANNVPNGAAKALVSWFNTERTKRTEAAVDRDMQFQKDSEDALRTKWGNDYRPNMARMDAFFAMAPAGLAEKLNAARFGDGSRVAMDPAFIEFVVDLSRQVNPAGVMLPGKGGTLSQSVEEELKGIDKRMREDRQGYDKDEPQQARYRELLTGWQKIHGVEYPNRRAG